MRIEERQAEKSHRERGGAKSRDDLAPRAEPTVFPTG